MRPVQRKPQREDGAVVVEFAIVFVLLVVLLSGLIQYGVIFAAEQSITHAVSEVTRIVVDIPDSNGDGQTWDEAETRIADELDQQLSWLDSSIDRDDGRRVDFTVLCDGCPDGTANCPECIEVTVTYNWAEDAIVPTMFPVATPDTLNAAASVQYQ